MLNLDQLDETLKFLQENNISKDKEIKQTQKLFSDWNVLKKLAKDTKKEIAPIVDGESKKNAVEITKHEESLKQYVVAMKKRDFYRYDTGKEQSFVSLGNVDGEMTEFIANTDKLRYNAEKFEQTGAMDPSQNKITEIQTEVGLMQALWDHINDCQDTFKGYMTNAWENTNTGPMTEQVQKLEKTLKGMKVDKKCNAYGGLLEEIKKWLKFIPLVESLRDPAMRERHWDQIRAASESSFVIDSNLTLKHIYDLDLGKIGDDVEEICDQAKQEQSMENTLKKIEESWVDVRFEFKQYKKSDLQLLSLSEENFEMLEEMQTQVNGMFSSRYLATFEEKCVKWQKALADIAEVVTLAGEVQRNWSFLEELFIHSAEVQKELPKESD